MSDDDKEQQGRLEELTRSMDATNQEIYRATGSFQLSRAVNQLREQKAEIEDIKRKSVQLGPSVHNRLATFAMAKSFELGKSVSFGQAVELLLNLALSQQLDIDGQEPSKEMLERAIAAEFPEEEGWRDLTFSKDASVLIGGELVSCFQRGWGALRGVRDAPPDADDVPLLELAEGKIVVFDLATWRITHVKISHYVK